jgi:YD repeat-containing protein
VTTLTYDAADRVIQVDQAADGQTRTTRATYNAVGDPLTLTDALGHTARFGPDDAGRVISQTLADGRQLDVRFDPRSNLTGLTPPRSWHACLSLYAG